MELIELNGITIVMDETKVLSDEIINSIYAASSQEYKGNGDLKSRASRLETPTQKFPETIKCCKSSP